MTDRLLYGVMLPLGAIVAGAVGLRMNPTFEWRRLLDPTIYRTKAAIVTGATALAIQAAFVVNDGDFGIGALALGLASGGWVALMAATAAGWVARRRKITGEGPPSDR